MTTSHLTFVALDEIHAWRRDMTRIMEGVARDVEAAFPGTPPIWRGHVCLVGFTVCGQPDCTVCGCPS